jgi:multidrug efflux pump
MIANDNSVFIDKSIKNVYVRPSLEAIALVALVIFVFLRTVRASDHSDHHDSGVPDGHLCA